MDIGLRLRFRTGGSAGGWPCPSGVAPGGDERAAGVRLQEDVQGMSAGKPGRKMSSTIIIFSSADHSEYVHIMAFCWRLRSGSGAFRLQRPSSDRLPAGLKWRSGSRIPPCAGWRTPSAWLFPCWHSEQICTPHPPTIGNRFISSSYRCKYPEPCVCYVTPASPEKRRSRIAIARRFGLGMGPST